MSNLFSVPVIWKPDQNQIRGGKVFPAYNCRSIVEESRGKNKSKNFLAETMKVNYWLAQSQTHGN